MGTGAHEVARAHLETARAARRRVDLDAHGDALGRMEAVLATLEDGPERRSLHRAAVAERIRDIGYLATDTDELRAADQTAAALLSEVGTDDPGVAARLSLARAQAAARLHEPGWRDVSTRHYTTAARRFIDNGERRDAAATLAALAWTVQLTTGGLRVVIHHPTGPV